jgi:uncharacterized FAD-dependent dehydrogenase
MSKIFSQIEIGLDDSLEEKLQWLSPNYGSYRIIKKSVDARQRIPHWVYSVEIFGPNEPQPTNEFVLSAIKNPPELRPIIVGAGPAGMFAALRLVERGVKCILIEQGSPAAKRMFAIASYWRYGKLDPKNNVCYGEGGAGLYSDGKLITRIKSPHIPYVLQRLVKFGAPPEIEFLSNPHVGSDKIRKLIAPFREYLISRGCEFRFDTKVSKLLYESDRIVGVELEDGVTLRSSAVILATGHSAEEMLYHLHENGVKLEGKSFAMGLRIEHPQKEINRSQYREYASHPALGAANYRLADHDPQTGIGVYSFCMCPGGYVISSGTSENGVVSNGMSNYARNSPFANAAIVISIDHEKSFGNDLFGGLKMRQAWESRARESVLSVGGNKQIPAQKVVDFLSKKTGSTLPTSSPSGVVPVRLDEFFSLDLHKRMSRALEKFHRSVNGFISPQAQFHGVETRTSSPVRITRDSVTLQSVSHQGLYPCGEGAGYAGGITSAAVDGVRVAEALLESF